MGEQSVKFFQQYVWQFQGGLFCDTPTSTSTGCCSSFLAGSVTETSFLCTYLSIGIPMVPRASQPSFPALLAPSSFDSYLVPSTSSPTLAHFGRESVHSWPRLRANPRENWWPKSPVALLVAPAKKRVVEITDILTLIQTFTI